MKTFQTNFSRTAPEIQTHFRANANGYISPAAQQIDVCYGQFFKKRKSDSRILASPFYEVVNNPTTVIIPSFVCDEHFEAT